jgi:hypothetical protein
MDTQVSSLIYDRFLRELAETDPLGAQLAAALRELHEAQQLHREARLLEIYRLLGNADA